ncbi:MAG: hypothetical protein ABSC06_28430 [Rhodopila sp.]
MPLQLSCQIGTVAAVFCTLDLASVRIALFERMVFSRGQAETEYDVPDKSVRNTLLNEAAFQILAVLWKESDYVTSSDLPIGVYKQFREGSISQLGLAKKWLPVLMT